MADQAPPLLTVEEAARVIRVGRTKAYAMAREWRTTAGRSGLPVVDLGHVLRVPRTTLEELLGVQITDVAQGQPRDESVATTERLQSEATALLRLAPTGRRKRQHDRPRNQLALFDTQAREPSSDEDA